MATLTKAEEKRVADHLRARDADKTRSAESRLKEPAIRVEKMPKADPQVGKALREMMRPSPRRS